MRNNHTSSLLIVQLSTSEAVPVVKVIDQTL